FVFPGVFVDGFVLARGIANNLVVHIRDVHHVLELVSALPQETPQNIHGHEGAEVADVPVVVNRGPAVIHADSVSLRWFELLHLTGERVVELKRQSPILGCREYFEQEIEDPQYRWNRGNRGNREVDKLLRVLLSSALKILVLFLGFLKAKGQKPTAGFTAPNSGPGPDR